MSLCPLFVVLCGERLSSTRQERQGNNTQMQTFGRSARLAECVSLVTLPVWLAFVSLFYHCRVRNTMWVHRPETDETRHKHEKQKKERKARRIRNGRCAGARMSTLHVCLHVVSSYSSSFLQLRRLEVEWRRLENRVMIWLPRKPGGNLTYNAPAWSTGFGQGSG
jgi:hypothetical protein